MAHGHSCIINHRITGRGGGYLKIVFFYDGVDEDIMVE
jgi:hypothetical protein